MVNYKSLVMLQLVYCVQQSSIVRIYILFFNQQLCPGTALYGSQLQNFTPKFCILIGSL